MKCAKCKNRRGNQEWTVQRHRQHWAQDTQQKQTIQKNTTRKNKKMNNMIPTKKHWVNLGASEG